MRSLRRDRMRAFVEPLIAEFPKLDSDLSSELEGYPTAPSSRAKNPECRASSSIYPRTSA